MSTPIVTPMTDAQYLDARRRYRNGEEVFLVATGNWTHTTAGKVYKVTHVDSDGDLYVERDNGSRDCFGRRHCGFFGVYSPAEQKAAEKAAARKAKLEALTTDELIEAGHKAQAKLGVVKDLLSERTAGLMA